MAWIEQIGPALRTRRFAAVPTVLVGRSRGVDVSVQILGVSACCQTRSAGTVTKPSPVGVLCDRYDVGRLVDLAEMSDHRGKVTCMRADSSNSGLTRTSTPSCVRHVGANTGDDSVPGRPRRPRRRSERDTNTPSRWRSPAQARCSGPHYPARLVPASSVAGSATGAAAPCTRWAGCPAASRATAWRAPRSGWRLCSSSHVLGCHSESGSCGDPRRRHLVGRRHEDYARRR